MSLSVNLPHSTLAAFQGAIINTTGVINGTEPDASAATYSPEGQDPRQYLVRADGAGYYPMVCVCVCVCAPPPPPLHYQST